MIEEAEQQRKNIKERKKQIDKVTKVVGVDQETETSVILVLFRNSIIEIRTFDIETKKLVKKQK